MDEKTALEKLIEYFNQQKRLQDDPMFIGSGREAYDDAIEVCQNIKKEIESEESGYRQGWMEDVREVLNDCADYMDNRKDADYEGEVYVPNREMILFSSITDVLEPLPYAPGENSGKEILVIGKTPYDEWLDKDEENSEPKNK